MKVKFVLFLGIASLATVLFGDAVVARDVHWLASGANNQRVIVKDRAGRLYIAYSKYVPATHHYQIYVARSTNGGVSWQYDWRKVTNDNYRHHITPSLAIDSNDTLRLVWVGNVSWDTSLVGDLIYAKLLVAVSDSNCPPWIRDRDTLYHGGAKTPAIAVGPDNSIHVVFTAIGPPYSIKYIRYDRGTSSWGTVEDVSINNPADWAGVDVDDAGQVHVIYRNTIGGITRIAHRIRSGGSWGPVEQIDNVSGTSFSEYTSMFVEGNDIYAVWDKKDAMLPTIDSITFRRYNSSTSSWEREQVLFAPTAPGIMFSSDVVVDTVGMVYVFYHDNDSIYLTYSYEGGVFRTDSALSDLYPAMYPNARGSNFPQANKVNSSCTDYVYTWVPPDSSGTVFLVYDRICDRSLCTDYLFPLDSTTTSCYDQPVRISVQCCRETLIVIDSDTGFIDYWNGSSWQPAVRVIDSEVSTWTPHNKVQGDAHYIWRISHTRDDSGAFWFRALLTYPCEEVETAFIEIQCDNYAQVYAHDTTGGTSGPYFVGQTGNETSICHGYGWWSFYSFDLTAFDMSGGSDTIYIKGVNVDVIAGLIFRVTFVCGCCPLDTTSFEITVNGVPYHTDSPELSWDGSVLTFTPILPDTYAHHDTITACLTAAADSCMRSMPDTLCRTFFVDYQPPFLVGVSLPPDTHISDTMPTFSFEVIDSMSGVDTSAFTFYLDSMQIPHSELNFENTGSTWVISWTPDTGFDYNETLTVCLHVEDSTDYCDDNVLDTCWTIYTILPCIDAQVWEICPTPWDNVITSCPYPAFYFGIWDPMGAGIDTTRIYATAIIHYAAGLIDTTSPYFNFRYEGDTLIVGSYFPLSDGDSLFIQLDSVFNVLGCKTEISTK